jgi:hypothetical protein
MALGRAVGRACCQGVPGAACTRLVTSGERLLSRPCERGASEGIDVWARWSSRSASCTIRASWPAGPRASAIRRRLGLVLQRQLHFDLLASTKLLTELTTLAESAANAAIWVAEGLDGSALRALWSGSTDDFTAVVWLGKSLLAALTSDVASLSIVLACVCRPLIPLLEVTLHRESASEFAIAARWPWAW